MNQGGKLPFPEAFRVETGSHLVLTPLSLMPYHAIKEA